MNSRKTTKAAPKSTKIKVKQEVLPGFDYENFGGESDEDISNLSSHDLNNTYLWATDWTIETIVNQVHKGYIQLSPTFQRRDAWKSDRKSRFIESIILNLPIPQIVLAERKDNKLVVVDGKQRLLSIMQFVGSDGWDSYKLSSLKLLKLNNKSYQDLQEDSTAVKFDNRTIRTVIIKNNPSNEFINTIFGRLNTNSVALSPQELRQSLFDGPFTTFAEQFTRDDNFLSELIGGGSGPDFRMRDVELIIRSIGFKARYQSYNGNLKLFLDNTCKELNKAWKSEKDAIVEIAVGIRSAMNAAEEIFGDANCKKYIPDLDSFEYRFNRAIFDVVAFYFSDPKTVASIKSRESEFIKGYKSLFSDLRFKNAIETTTKSIDAVNARFQIFGQLIRAYNPKAQLPSRL